MRINVNLATNRLQLETFVGGNLYSSVTYTNIVAVSDGKDVNRLVTAPTPSGPPTTTTTKDDFIVRLHLADQKHVDLPLAYIENQPGWTNDQAGYEQAEEDIYAAFPTGGGGGSGTVTSVNVSGGTTGFSFTGGPITTSGTITMSGSPVVPINTGNTLWVDVDFGDDGTGTANRQDLPYATVMAALANASEADTIIVRPGITGEAVTDADGPSVAYIYMEPGASILSLSINDAGSAWEVVGGIISKDVTMDTSSGNSLVLQTVSIGADVECNSFGAILLRECLISGSATAENAGSLEFRNCQVGGTTTSSGGTISSYNTVHLSDATVDTGGTMQGFASEIGGLVTDDPVTGDFWDGVAGGENTVATGRDDGRWGWVAQPLQYKFHGDGGAATGTVAKNTYPTTFTVTNPAAGDYRFTADAGTPFTAKKTFVSVMPIDGSTPLGWKLEDLQTNQVRLLFYDTTSGSATDPNPGYTITIETVP